MVSRNRVLSGKAKILEIVTGIHGNGGEFYNRFIMEKCLERIICIHEMQAAVM